MTDIIVVGVLQEISRKLDTLIANTTPVKLDPIVSVGVDGSLDRLNDIINRTIDEVVEKEE